MLQSRATLFHLILFEFWAEPGTSKPVRRIGLSFVNCSRRDLGVGIRPAFYRWYRKIAPGFSSTVAGNRRAYVNAHALGSRCVRSSR